MANGNSRNSHHVRYSWHVPCVRGVYHGLAHWVLRGNTHGWELMRFPLYGWWNRSKRLIDLARVTLAGRAGGSPVLCWSPQCFLIWLGVTHLQVVPRDTEVSMHKKQPSLKFIAKMIQITFSMPFSPSTFHSFVLQKVSTAWNLGTGDQTGPSISLSWGSHLIQVVRGTEPTSGKHVW